MERPSEWISPKQVARAIGVSESSLKRWCDQGLIETVRTVGGHRKMPTADVLRFVREHDHPLVAPEILGLPPVSDHADLGLARSKPRMVEALLAGNELLARQIVFDLFLAKHPISAVCDDVIAAAFHEIGDRWACRDAEVYQERRGCEIARRVLFDLRKMQLLPKAGWVATGATVEGDPYALPTVMAELVLREAGFHATSMGANIPFASLIKSVEETRPKLFWLSVSSIAHPAAFLAGFTELTRTCALHDAALVVGGRALTEELRQQMSYSAFGDTMRHLERFAKTLLRASKSKASKRSGRSAPAKGPGPNKG